MAINFAQITWTESGNNPKEVSNSVTMVDGLTPSGEVEAANGAIGIKNGRAVITKSTAATLTLALPTATTDDYKTLVIEDTTGKAHTVTTPSNGINGSLTTITFSGQIGDSVELMAYQGVWYYVNGSGVALS